MDYKKILIGLLSRAYKFDDGKNAEILDGENKTEQDVLDLLLAEDSTRVSLLKKQNSDNKDAFNQGYAKAKKEERTTFENELKDEYGVESSNTGLDLINEIVSAKVEASGKTGTITDDDVKKHPVYQAAERQYKKDLTAKEKDYNDKVADLETQNKRAQTFFEIKERANTILESLKPVLSPNAKVAANTKRMFLQELEGYDYETQPDGSVIVTKDGKIIDDGHGHTKGFEDIVKSTVESYYDLQGNNGGANAGNENQDRGNGGNASPKFKNQDEADAYLLNDSIPINDRVKAVDDWKASQQSEV